MFNFNALTGKLGKWMHAAADKTRGKKFSVKELVLDADEYGVKSKLGASFFCKHLSRGTRRARINSLSNAEYALAHQKGWL